MFYGDFRTMHTVKRNGINLKKEEKRQDPCCVGNYIYVYKYIIENILSLYFLAKTYLDHITQDK